MNLGIHGSYIGGGYWHPSSKILKSIREAIDYNGEEFYKILKKCDFKKTFGDLIEEDSLKMSPKGFSEDHRFIELLRRKSFVVIFEISKEEVFRSNFDDRVVDVYKEMLPFRRDLNKAVTV